MKHRHAYRLEFVAKVLCALVLLAMACGSLGFLADQSVQQVKRFLAGHR